MIIINDDHILMSLTGARDGTQMSVRVHFVSKSNPLVSTTYERSMAPAEYGEWAHEFFRVTEGTSGSVWRTA